MRTYPRSTVYHCPAPLCNWAVEQDDAWETITIAGFMSYRVPKIEGAENMSPLEKINAISKQIIWERAADVEEAVKDHLESDHPIYLSWLKITNKNVRARYGK